ncbi:MAG: hypothetical protein V3G42_14285 [Oscillospiraceae bacterium]
MFYQAQSGAVYLVYEGNMTMLTLQQIEEISHELAGKLVNIALSVLKNQGKADNPETGFWHKID